MGAKGRVLRGFLADILEQELPDDGSVLDLFSGTAIVASHCARRYRTIANDALKFCQVIAKGFIEHDPRKRKQFVAAPDFDADLRERYLQNRTRLEEHYAPALCLEKYFLDQIAPVGSNGNGRRAGRNTENLSCSLAAYRLFLEIPDAVYRKTKVRQSSDLYRKAQALLSEGSIGAYRADSKRRPYCLATAYYANIYFGVRQSIEIDSLRAAIDAIKPDAPFADEKKTHYLSALIHCASVSTSGTSHFAQPRHLRKDSEVLAMARRRRIDIVETFLKFSQEIRAVVADTTCRKGNAALAENFHELIEENGAGARFKDSVRADLVYVDPPYTSDNHSRFYHALEVLTTYDYPELASKNDEFLRGRYPAIETRFQSAFCRAGSVEQELERVIQATAGSGSKLVISYGSPNGLLLKTYARRDPGCDPVGKLEELCGRYFHGVTTHKQRILHSGQGDMNVPSDELLVVCTGPKGGSPQAS